MKGKMQQRESKNIKRVIQPVILLVIGFCTVILLAIIPTSSRVVDLEPPSVPIPKSLFGMHMHRATTETAWPETSFDTWRLWDARVAWPNLEAEQGKWDFRLLDDCIDLAKRHNVEVIVPLALSPTWAAARPNEPSAYQMGNASAPQNIEDWRAYVRQVATRYKGRVHYYEIWNEPNLVRFYSGTTEQMVSLAQEAYKILKGIDPSILVVSPSPTGGGDGLPWLEDYLRRGGGDYADVIGYHFYVSPHPPEEMLKTISKVQDILSKYNVSNKPLWNTETGWVITDSSGSVDPTEVGFSAETEALNLNEASSYVARSYILSWATGVQRFYWYAWDNYVMGLVERDGKTLKPPAVAYAEIQKWLVDAEMKSCKSDSQKTWVCVLERPNNYKGRIVWNPEQTVNFQIPNDWSIQQVRDLTGGQRSIANSSSIEITTSPLLLENKS